MGSSVHSFGLPVESTRSIVPLRSITVVAAPGSLRSRPVQAVITAIRKARKLLLEWRVGANDMVYYTTSWRRLRVGELDGARLVESVTSPYLSPSSLVLLLVLLLPSRRTRRTKTRAR